MKKGDFTMTEETINKDVLDELNELTPEAAAQKFIRLIGPAMNQAVAAVLAQSLGKAKDDEKGMPQWTTLIRTAALNMDFGTPEGVARGALSALAQAKIPGFVEEEDGKGIDGSISIVGTIRF